MPHHTVHVPTLESAVRAHFGLSQAELARFVGVSRFHPAMVEAGHKALSPGPTHRLYALARHLPPPAGSGPPAPLFALAAATAGPSDAALLRERLATVRYALTKQRLDLGRLDRGAACRHARRPWAAKVLGAALPAPVPVPGILPLAAPPDPVADARWLGRLAADTAAAPVPLTPTDYALGQARQRGLEAEAAALEERLGFGTV